MSGSLKIVHMQILPNPVAAAAAAVAAAAVAAAAVAVAAAAAVAANERRDSKGEPGASSCCNKKEKNSILWGGVHTPQGLLLSVSRSAAAVALATAAAPTAGGMLLSPISCVSLFQCLSYLITKKNSKVSLPAAADALRCTDSLAHHDTRQQPQGPLEQQQQQQQM